MKRNAPYIYLVDDSEINLKTISKYLKHRFNCNIRPFKTAEKCWKTVKKRTPSLVLSDYHLNDFNKESINGDKLLLKIKNQYPKVSTFLYSSDYKMNKAFANKKEFSFLPRDNRFNSKLYGIVRKNFKLFEEKQITRSVNTYLYISILLWILGFYLTSIEKEPFAVLTFFVALVFSIIYSNKKTEHEYLT